MSTLVPVISSAARTTSGTSLPVDVPDHASDISVRVNCSAASGTTPTLDVTVEWSTDGTVWFTADPAQAFTQLTAVARLVRKVPALANKMRVAYAIAGTTPSFTFSADYWMP